MILTPLQKLPNNVGDLGKTIVATGFEWLPKVQKIAQSGHTAESPRNSKLVPTHKLSTIVESNQAQGKVETFIARG